MAFSSSSSRFFLVWVIIQFGLITSSPGSSNEDVLRMVVPDDGPVNVPATLDVNLNSIPASVDWRNRGAVTPVKDIRGSCNGSSWAFAAAGAVEAVNRIVTGSLVALSAQQLIDCETEYGSEGCVFGESMFAFDYLVESSGLALESAYPFTGRQGKCKTVQGFEVTIDGSYRRYVSQQNNDTDIVEMVSRQPVTAIIDGNDPSFKQYRGGIYKGPCNDDGSGVNLISVLIVGYGVECGKKYWIVKNNWGTGWGENGYMRIERGNFALPRGRCGINTQIVYPIKKNDPLQTGLLSFWKLDKQQGPVADSVGSTQCNITGSVFRSGDHGIYFPGSSFLSCGTGASLSGKTSFTVSVWVLIKKSQGVIIQQRSPSGFNGEYQLIVDNKGQPQFWIYGDGLQQFSITAPVIVNDFKWHHIVAVRDNHNGLLYVDGAESSSDFGPTVNLDPSLAIYIAADIRDNVNFLSGYIKNVRIYQRAVSAEEVKLLEKRERP